jgi:POT family proton-dependent oligopeptide transporter
MLYATLVQHFIYSSGDVKINVWIVAPLYFLLAIGEVFAVVTAMEYAYDHSPKDMKAVVQAVSLLIAGVGSAVAMALTPAAHDPLMVTFYGSLTGAMVLTIIIFYIIFRHYDGQTIVDEEKPEEPAVRPPNQVQVGADVNEGAVGVFPQEHTASGATPVDEKKSPGVEIKGVV